jgi:hypothetical protein
MPMISPKIENANQNDNIQENNLQCGFEEL